MFKGLWTHRLNFSLSQVYQRHGGIWLVADLTLAMRNVILHESYESRNQRYDRRFCLRDNVCVASSISSTRKIVIICQYPLNVGEKAEIEPFFTLSSESLVVDPHTLPQLGGRYAWQDGELG